MLTVKLFGSGRLLDGDTEVRLSSRNWTLPLLAYVVLHRTEIIPRWRLAFTLWPDETEDDALQNLRRNLHRLVKALPQDANGKPWMSIDAENIAWNNAAHFQLDLAEYERLRGDPATLEEAVALYAGDLLEDIYDDWVTAERERFRRLHHADLTALIVATRAQRAYGKAISYAQRLLTLDSWREDTLRHLMSARYESGDAAGALAEFDRFARGLRDEMQAAPMQETIALRDAIARGDATPGTLDAPKATERREPLATPFVGRERELEQLRGHWRRAASGAGALVLVRGDAGIGKSRLVSELALAVESEGGRVLWGTTSSPEREPRECVAGALRQGLAMIAALPLSPAVFSVVAELVPELRARLPNLPPLPQLDEHSDRLRLFDAIAQTVAALARARPLLIILEDVQWADTATIETIKSLAQRSAGAPVLLVATSREDQVAGVAALRLADRVAVGPLAESAIVALTHSIAPIDAAAHLARLVFERSRGNPLFATEMLRDAARGPYDAATIPQSIAAMVASRIAALRPSAQALAQVAAVAGAAFSFHLVHGVSGSSEADVLADLDELFDWHLIRELTERGRYEYTFTHDLVRQAIYEAMPRDVRTRRHLRVGHVLERAYADETVKPDREIALHYDLGGHALAAARWYLQAARRAASLYANVEASDLATRGLELATDVACPERSRRDRLRFDLLLVRQEANLRRGERDAHEADLKELNALGEGVGAEAALTALRLNVERAHNWGKVEEEVAAAAQLRERADTSGDPQWLARAMTLQATVLVRAARQAEALVPALQARALYEELADAAGQVHAATFASAACTGLGHNAQAERYYEEALLIAKRVGDPMLQLLALRAAIAQTYESQRFARSAEFAREMLRLSSDVGHCMLEAMSHANIADACWRLWRIDEGLTHSRAASELREPTGWTYYSNYPIFAHGDLGNFDEAIRSFDRLESGALRIGRRVDAAGALNGKAYIWWQRGEIDPMRKVLEDASKLAEEIDYQPTLMDFARNRARLLRHDGDFDESAALLEKTIEDLRAWDRPADTILTVDELAATYLAAGRYERAIARVEESAALAVQLEDPRVLRNPVMHHWIATQVYRAAGDEARAQASLNAALQTYEQRRNAIGDASLRASFETMPLHRELLAATAERSSPR